MQGIILKILEVIMILYLIKISSKNMGKFEKLLSILLLIVVASDLVIYFMK